MDFKLRQRPSRAPVGSALVGDGLIRLRSASIALMATVAAIGLALVAFVSQMGWPTVRSGPIPAGPELGVVRNDPIVAPRAPVRSAPGAQRGDWRAAATRPGSARRDDPGSGLAPVHEVQPDPAGSAPTPQPSPPAPPQPIAPTEPAAIVVTTPSHDSEQSPPKQRAAEEKPPKSRSGKAKPGGGKAKPESRRGRRTKTAAASPATGGGGMEGNATQHGPSGEVGAEDAKDGADPGKGGERGKRGRGPH